jgi:hypothetical protein
MTTQARLVLADARAALTAHTTSLSGPAFRSSWFSIVGLLRAVGHVLAKVDAERDRHLAATVNAEWKKLTDTRPEPKIFWGFIESERNRLLKNYEHGITRLKVLRTDSPLQTLGLDLANAGKAVQLVSLRDVPPEVPDNAVVSFLSDGPYAGRPESEVATEAIEWWEQYLLNIERSSRADTEA